MAMYECFDSFSAMRQLLDDSGPDFDPAARLLVTEYCKYALHRAWFYYPDALPAEAIADEFRNGRVDRRLSFPVEDLYSDGSPAGQVGQEIYGAGAAFVFAAAATRPIDGQRFHTYCDQPVAAWQRAGFSGQTLTLAGADDATALLAVARSGRTALPDLRLTIRGDEQVAPRLVADDRVEWEVPADARVTVRWDVATV